MKKIGPDDTSFKTFQEILTGYRLSHTLKSAYESGVFEVINESRLQVGAICEQTGWDETNGGRFLDALAGLGFLENNDALYSLSLFSKKFLLKQSDNFQGMAVEFEDRLIESWGLLSETLEKGERIYSTESKTEKEYEKALKAYLAAMNDAAKIRACEMWDRFKPVGRGRILDAGAGGGAFLVEFLNRYGHWDGIFCDLKDVIAVTARKPELVSLAGRITYIEKNLLEAVFPDKNAQDVKADIAVLSNLVHCQGKAETKVLLSNILSLVADDGIVLIHDFFSDCGWWGALYDIHMMVNTYNGRTYSIDEMMIMLADFEFLHFKKFGLDSGSTLFAASKKPIPLEFFS